MHYLTVQDVLLGTKTYASDENLSPADVASDVDKAHETIDDLKEWSANTHQWLEGAIQEAEDDEYEAELRELQEYVMSVRLRVEQGDEMIRSKVSDENDSENEEMVIQE